MLDTKKTSHSHPQHQITQQTPNKDNHTLLIQSVLSKTIQNTNKHTKISSNTNKHTKTNKTQKQTKSVFFLSFPVGNHKNQQQNILITNNYFI